MTNPGAGLPSVTGLPSLFGAEVPAWHPLAAGFSGQDREVWSWNTSHCQMPLADPRDENFMAHNAPELFMLMVYISGLQTALSGLHSMLITGTILTLILACQLSMPRTSPHNPSEANIPLPLTLHA